MWGSDWPVCRLRGEYEDWRAAAMKLTESLSNAETESIYGQTANHFYDLGL
jgi:L-fuconolactonase